MAWLKRNVGLVVSGLISLGLLGFATYYLFVKKAEADEASAKLQQATDELNRLVNRTPGVSPDNITEAKGDQQKIEKFTEAIKHFFVPPPFPKEVNNRDFGILLDRTLSELRHTADQADTKLPLKDYKFSFASQATAPNIALASLEPLAAQLLEISTICNVLFGAKVNALDAVKRSPVTSDETAGMTDFLTAKPETNEWTVITPYEVTFKGFSGELAQVLHGFAKTSNCIIVKNIVVQRADAPVETPVTDTSAAGAATPPAGADPYARYGMGGMRMRMGGARGMSPDLARRYGLPSAGAPAEAPQQSQTKRNPAVVRDEQLLRVVLTLETVRLKPVTKTSAAPAPRTPRSAPPADGAATPTPADGTESATQ
jgi:hypothetical protein